MVPSSVSHEVRDVLCSFLFLGFYEISMYSHNTHPLYASAVRLLQSKDLAQNPDNVGSLHLVRQ